MDLSNFYHQLVLPEWIRPYFAIPALGHQELVELCNCEDIPFTVRAQLRSAGSSLLYPCCTTLPMGFSPSVFLAQSCHEHILYSSGALSPRDNLLNLSPHLDRSIHGLYIDDCNLFSPSLEEGTAQYQAILAAYQRAGLSVKLSKCQPPTFHPVIVLGVEVDGGHGVIIISVERYQKLLAATLQLLSCRLVSGKQLAVIVGGWTWQLLLRRPSLVAFKHTYRFIDRNMNTPAALWPCVSRELAVVMSLAPLLRTDLKCQLASDMVATDSSSYAAGVVTTHSSPTMEHVMWPLSSSQHCSLLPAAAAAAQFSQHSYGIP